jgi:hypothetical protein
MGVLRLGSPGLRGAAGLRCLGRFRGLVAGNSATLVCAYPNDLATAAAIRHAHPSLLNGAATPSPDHLPADQFLAHHPLPPPTELGQPDATHIIDHPAQLTELRKFTGSHAARAGLPTSRREDFVLAVTEVATNALQHGDLPAAVCL